MDFVVLRTKAEQETAPRRPNWLIYLYGADEVEIDYGQAYRWLSAAAEKGVSRAIANLAVMYAGGLGVPKDAGEAIPLYERVGDVEFFAAIALGRIYLNGVGVHPDPVKALRWYSVAAAFEGDISDCDELSEAKTYVRGSEHQ
jgi:hypothetical protein